mgnify:CR=1 FL=1
MQIINNADFATGIILRHPTTNSSVDEVLLQKKDSGYPWSKSEWCFFGGKIEKEESPLRTFQREVLEELGIEVKDVAHFATYPFTDLNVDGKKVRRGNSHVFVADYDGQISNIKLREGAGFAFLSPYELAKHPVVDHEMYILRDFYRLNYGINI